MSADMAVIAKTLGLSLDPAALAAAKESAESAPPADDEQKRQLAAIFATARTRQKAS